MIHTYRVEGMTCKGCASKVRKTLLEVPGITSADIDLDKKKAVVSMKSHIGFDVLSRPLSRAGTYRLHEDTANSPATPTEMNRPPRNSCR